MKPLTTIYWTRAALGLVIGVLCTVYIYFSVSSDLISIYTLLTGISFAILFYLATYYVIKSKFFARVEKQQKIITQGIGIYFFAWIVSWTLIVTMLMPSASVNIYINDTGNLAEGQEFWVTARGSTGQLVQNKTTTSGTLRMALLPPGAYTFELGNTNQSQELTLDWLQNLNVVFNVTPVSG
ncbi:MAG: hypothetical protein OEY24_07490 [Candidatus Bathyarchaeota archaeon]|nr:hypothetical protein [Candidatus Bathyarchaeota archaeon]MDH5495523.1 hypothetical protein [Candidatus Bathyarchaeota archaeon]